MDHNTCGISVGQFLLDGNAPEQECNKKETNAVALVAGGE